MDFASKEEFRSYCKEKILRLRGSRRIVEKLIWLIEGLGGRELLLYLPMEHEPDILPLFSYFRRKRRLFVPLVRGENIEIVPFRLPLRRGRFSLFEPRNSHFSRPIDIAVIPVLGVDGEFRRIGFGRGFYDRLVEKMPYPPITIFVQEGLCMTRRPLGAEHDVQGDFLVTPKEIIVRGDSDVGRSFSRKFCRHTQWRCRIYVGKKGRKRAVQRL
ncbi:MAG: 5-formyltetrahydrofolate cyclo-ligase [Epsilonproteobacteria bacterium]|nr:5-formyltetrahydrofolate cyclo-ligase [Campylobacterota bacterium]NPA57104.1 5-formyltetrahydrofolate cyclo-ligase [Campylobacterota bacterium]